MAILATIETANFYPNFTASDMMVIGLAGGIASGKSLVASQFRSLGAEVVDADKVGHQVLKFPSVIREIQSIWGDSVLTDDQVDRGKLAKIVFADTQLGRDDLQRLESITHPRIREEIELQIEQLKSEEVPAIVLDAPVMFKTGWYKICDKIVFIEASFEARSARVLARGWSVQELFDREKQQFPLEGKRQLATDFVDNSSTPDEAFAQVKAMWLRWNFDN